MFERFKRIYKTVCTYALIFSALGVLVQMFYVAFNVFGRYFFNFPLAGSMEASGEMMIYIVYMSLAYIQLRDNHIRIDFLFSKMGKRTKAVFDILAQLLGMIFFAFIIWYAWGAAMHSLAIREVSAGQVLFPLYPQRIAVIVGSAMMFIQLIINLIDTVGALIKPERMARTTEVTEKLEVI